MKKLTLLLVLTLLSACNPKKNSVKSNVATISGVEVGAQCVGQQQMQNQVGAIYDSTGSAYEFENRVKALLTVNLQPNEVGSISASDHDQTGVRFSGQMKLDNAGNVVGASSKVIITVYDSNIFQGQQPIKIEFNPSLNNGATISGQFNSSTGDGFVSLRDSYGEVRFEGRIDAQKFSGIVKFQNSVNVMGGTPLSGTLGQFYIQRCAFLQ